MEDGFACISPGRHDEPGALGIEAAFASENPVDGDQQSFARIRIRASVPTPGTYRITHPYGVETVVVNTPGSCGILMAGTCLLAAPSMFT